MRRCAQFSALVPSTPASSAFRQRLRRFPLPKPVKGAILPSKTPGSGEYRVSRSCPPAPPLTNDQIRVIWALVSASCSCVVTYRYVLDAGAIICLP